ncbi:hypothetical protein [Mesorhizobium sp. LSJC264A00]|uniref:hypothetical protein n=1 Tax=unclassified Mesorhizobium TaxID=325217 RepID=UPI001FDA799A|nr:hypothetical protein [Mesorhizobium sp. LSJC264A00]
MAISRAHLRPAGSARRGCGSIEREPEPHSDAAFRNASQASASDAVPPFAELETKGLCATPYYPRLVLRENKCPATRYHFVFAHVSLSVLPAAVRWQAELWSDA